MSRYSNAVANSQAAMPIHYRIMIESAFITCAYGPPKRSQYGAGTDLHVSAEMNRSTIPEIQ